ncbi:MAG TPA: phospholipase D-like domain-containing protein [Terriglobia bacterium]|nr:phospholipase D-like domain-containing protein [Terriglobia bacterium]
MNVEALLTREHSVSETIERLIQQASVSFDAALYRFNSQSLARALDEAARRGVRVRLVLDRGKYEESQATRELLAKDRFPFRLSHGRDGEGSKMHHKFALLDDAVLLTGSYNWTRGSDKENYENLLVLREPGVIKIYRREFEALWKDAQPS